MQPERLVKDKYFSKGNKRSDERLDEKGNLSCWWGTAGFCQWW